MLDKRCKLVLKKCEFLRKIECIDDQVCRRSICARMHVVLCSVFPAEVYAKCTSYLSAAADRRFLNLERNVAQPSRAYAPRAIDDTVRSIIARLVHDTSGFKSYSSHFVHFQKQQLMHMKCARLTDVALTPFGLGMEHITVA